MRAQHATECELLVMKCVWMNPDKELSMPAINELVNKTYDKDWAPQTVSTFLKRLRNRGFLEAERRGRSFVYHSLIDAEEYKAATVMDCCEFWCNGDAAKMLEIVKNERGLSQEEVKKIKELL